MGLIPVDLRSGCDQNLFLKPVTQPENNFRSLNIRLQRGQWIIKNVLHPHCRSQMDHPVAYTDKIQQLFTVEN
ncbi:MAG: hypothetical protein BWY82_01514 [Verrucomicrobia bacterium ADurb.Bin474]|nr:MAG: hypothetical protein BWY82_01514 [Verrucomicrobia bacterium ADurb.Bin474]